MSHALALARRALGRVAPNPAVGCVIVSSAGRVIGRGWTQPGGRPHAEAAALKEAGTSARGGTAYVSLEPCAHYGETPPCADALIAAGLSRVVAAMEDPDPRVKGKGFARMREAGLEVVSGVLSEQAAEVNAGFFLRILEGRPHVTLKIAQSLDGKTATALGESKWITGPEARRFGHLLRAQSDAILIGSGTAIADDPELTCRLSGLEERSPLRIILDSRGRLGAESNIAKTAGRVRTIQFTANPGASSGLVRCGIEVVAAPLDAVGRVDIAAMLAELGKRGVTRLLVEGGATVQASFLDAGLVDRIELFTAPLMLGARAHDSAAAISASTLEEAPRFSRAGRRVLGVDLLESFVRRA
jgi:diaminohydroxyphosphoribosylaminopyrimidine deaminase/5-amino-6-(5-phosphoribosylamino)uracil reductase